MLQALLDTTEKQIYAFSKSLLRNEQERLYNERALRCFRLETNKCSRSFSK